MAYLRILWAAKWKILAFSLLVGGATLGHMMTRPNIYRSTAVISPTTGEAKQATSFGVLASFGIVVGGPSRAEDLESLFKSDDLTVRVFRRHNPWPHVLGDRFDPSTGKMKSSRFARWLGERNPAEPPGDWDAIRAAKERLKVSVNRKAGTVSVSFESPSAQGSAELLRHYLEEAKSRLQEEALDRAVKNKRFIEEQIGRTVDALTRDRLYSLYGQEVEREMLARNREQFAFTVVDSPRVPDRKSGPARARTAAAWTFSSFLAACGYFLIRKRP